MFATKRHEHVIAVSLLWGIAGFISIWIIENGWNSVWKGVAVFFIVSITCDIDAWMSTVKRDEFVSFRFDMFDNNEYRQEMIARLDRV